MSAPEAGDAPATSPHPPFPPRACVLIVDDLAQNRTMLGLVCDQFGLGHECVENGRDAVEAVQSGRFDVVLMDIFMLKMDGLSATQAIRALPGRIGAVPIIAVTSAASPGEIARYLTYGMDDVVPRPIEPARLAQALARAFATNRRESWPSLVKLSA